MEVGRMADRISAVGWLRFGLYGISAIASLGTIVIGALSEKTSNSWETAFIGFYIAWTITFGLFVLSFAGHPGVFVLRCLYYFACSACTLVFFSAAGNISSGSLHTYIPGCASIGVFVGIGLKQGLALLTWPRIQDWLLRLLLPARDQEILPRFVNEQERRSALDRLTNPTPRPLPNAESSEIPNPGHASRSHCQMIRMAPTEQGESRR